MYAPTKFDKSHLKSFEEQQALYEKSMTPTFWAEMAQKEIIWTKPFTKVLEGSLELGNVTWFRDGELNVCYNCVDRHMERNPDKIAFIWE